MTKDNFTTATKTLERVISRVKVDRHLKCVKISLVCSYGGISDIFVAWDEGGICCFDDSTKNTDDPNKARVHFHYMLQKIKDTRHNGKMVISLSCEKGMIYNSAITEEYNNLFGRDIGIPLET